MGTELQTILSHNGVSIVADPDNLTSLTALWKAAGSEHVKRPNEWLKTGPAKEFIASLAANVKANGIALVKTKRGGKTPGVWAHWQVAMAYAKWLSPEFHQAVNEGFRRWYEEEKNPALKLDRSVEKLRAKGHSIQWIKSRVDGKGARIEFTSTLRDHNCKVVGKTNPYREATTSINLAAIGKTAREYKVDKGLPAKAKTRDHMTSRELMRIAFMESEATAMIQDRAADGNDECLHAVKTACKAVKAAIQVMQTA